jgi:hypothetical protein
MLRFFPLYPQIDLIWTGSSNPIKSKIRDLLLAPLLRDCERDRGKYTAAVKHYAFDSLLFCAVRDHFADFLGGSDIPASTSLPPDSVVDADTSVVCLPSSMI